ncbi:IscS subfamily cysteine desulfurase [Virgibacillus xinjiangensis]|uniref:IscS subfamily cysteine desulfurase n=1 Tax=Virgibacillus xinjiangensis TaxID=393090 RepID=A0ABV7CRA2_9BACI
MIYLDYAATTPVSNEAIDSYIKASKDYFGNPSSLHDTGSHSLQLLEMCRSELSRLLNGDQDGFYFTGSGSEANVLALLSLMEAHKHKGNHIITSHGEHSSVRHFFQRMENKGFEITYLPTDETGRVRILDLEAAVKSTTILVSIQFVNAEIGTIQPIGEIGELLDQRGVIFHCDAVQAFGKMDINIHQLKIDSLSVSSHKIYGPKGVGAAYIAPKVKWIPTIPSTTHEKGFRPGTVNVPGIAAFIAAAESVYTKMAQENQRISSLRAEMVDLLTALPVPIYIEGSSDHCLAHILGFRIGGMEGQYAMLECNRHGVAISTGSACQSGNQEPSSTLLALGRSNLEAKQLIRLSFGEHTTRNDIHTAAEVFKMLTEEYFSAIRR